MLRTSHAATYTGATNISLVLHNFTFTIIKIFYIYIYIYNWMFCVHRVVGAGKKHE